MTRRERLEKRLEKRISWAESRNEKSDECMLLNDTLRKPFSEGQPILVGHHSEKMMRARLERLHNLVGTAIEHKKVEEHHLEKADGLKTILSKTVFLDDPDAAERTMEKIQQLEDEIEAYALEDALRKTEKREKMPRHSWRKTYARAGLKRYREKLAIIEFRKRKAQKLGATDGI